MCLWPVTVDLSSCSIVVTIVVTCSVLSDDVMFSYNGLWLPQQHRRNLVPANTPAAWCLRVLADFDEFCMMTHISPQELTSCLKNQIYTKKSKMADGRHFENC